MPLRHDPKASGETSQEACHALLSVLHIPACMGALNEHEIERVLSQAQRLLLLLLKRS